MNARALELILTADDARARALAAGRIWIQAALISNGSPMIYADSRRTRDAACALLRLLLALRRIGGVRIISWRVSP